MPPFRHTTTFRLGGPCRALLTCATADEVRRAVELTEGRFLLIGGGSNLLVADAGVDETVVRYVADAPRIVRRGEVAEVGAGTSLDDLARWSVEEGLDGLVNCTGIPGTVGGAVAGNAGAFGEQIGDIVEEVRVCDRQGRVRARPAADLAFAYRTSALQRSDEVILSVLLHLRPGTRELLAARRAEIQAVRAAKHPDWRAIGTAGSFFKNVEPTSRAGRRQAAGWFLEQAGALRMRVGGARPFERHANIIVADPGATALDVHQLAAQMAAAVREQFGLQLEREVRLIGSFPS